MDKKRPGIQAFSDCPLLDAPRIVVRGRILKSGMTGTVCK
jgi:hypothetical protein